MPDHFDVVVAGARQHSLMPAAYFAEAGFYTPIGWGKPVNERLAEHPDGKRWLRRIAMSGWDIIRENFEDDHCRSFMLWMAFQTVVPPEWPMSGRLAYSLVWGRQRWS